LLQPASSFASASLGEVFEGAISAPGLDVTPAKGEGSPHEPDATKADADVARLLRWLSEKGVARQIECRFSHCSCAGTQTS
jgi:hypothetical protein